MAVASVWAWVSMAVTAVWVVMVRFNCASMCSALAIAKLCAVLPLAKALDNIGLE